VKPQAGIRLKWLGLFSPGCHGRPHCITPRGPPGSGLEDVMTKAATTSPSHAHVEIARERHHRVSPLQKRSFQA
jgi:hypothetical protein